MKELKTLEFELRETEKQIEDLLLRIKQLRKEMSEIYPKQKVLYEQHKTKVDKYIINNGYSIKSILPVRCNCINYVTKHNKYLDKKYVFPRISNNELIPINSTTSLIIETYIPSKNVVLVVEL